MGNRTRSPAGERKARGSKPNPSRTVAPAGLNVLAMPTGPVCNLNCAYCYYLDKDRLYPGNRDWRMKPDTLELFVRQYIEAQPPHVQNIVFGWQGGEPTLLPLDFYQRVVALQRRYCPSGKTCTNTIQTNGLRLDERFCEFLKAHDFLVGLSLDGPAELHDMYRVDHRGHPTHERVMETLHRLQRLGLAYNVLTVVHAGNQDYGQRVYRYLVDEGVQFIQFIPLVEPRRASRRSGDALSVDEGTGDPSDVVTERSVGSEQYGRFLIGVFDEWRRGDSGHIFVQIFDEALSAWCGIEPSLCVFRRECGTALAIEHNGDVFSCDHFVSPDYHLGNIHETTIVDLAGDNRQIEFGRSKLRALSHHCRCCDVRFVCNGGCPKNRLLRTPDGESGLNYLCGGYKLFFHHVRPYMEDKAARIRASYAKVDVGPRMCGETNKAAPAARNRPARINRNDPCSCGSGRKFKTCCGAG